MPVIFKAAMASTPLPAENFPPSPISAPPAGADNYVIGDEIAQGGMGSILEAMDTKLLRTVAAKVMSLDAENNPAIRERFLREAQVLATLEHPNIVPIHDVIWEGGEPLFYTMKLVKGRNLQAILDDLRDGKPDTLREHTLDRLLIIFLKVCDAMAFAHSKDVLHRDLKPANVMVGEFGEVLVMDWGLAKRRTGAPAEDDPAEDVATSTPAFKGDVTLHGAVLGTPHYMSPEQAQGGMRTLDQRSDVYSLGAMLYAILLLRRPVEGKTVAEVLQKVINSNLVSPLALQADPGFKPLPHIRGGRVPTALSAVAMRALNYEPERRYPSVTALSADIEAYQSGRATQAENASPLRQIWLLMRRHRTGTAAIAALLLLSFVFVLKVMAGERAARAAETVALHERDNASHALALSNISLAEAAYHERDSGPMRTALDMVPETLRNTDWHYLNARTDTSVATLDASYGKGCGIAAHPTRPGVFAVAMTTRQIVMVEGRTGKVLSRIPITAEKNKDNIWYRALDFSADGKRLVVGGFMSKNIAIYDADTGAVLTQWEFSMPNRAKFSADGSQVMLIGHVLRLALFDAHTGQERWHAEHEYRQGTFLPSGHIFASSRYNFHVLDIATGKILREYPPLAAEASQIVLAPDGASVFIGCHDGVVRRMRLDDGAILFEQRLSGHVAHLHIAVSTDGRQVVGAASLANHARRVRVWNTDTGMVLQNLMGGTSKIEGVAFHPLTGEILISGAQTKIWAPAASLPSKWNLPNGTRFSSVFWSEDLFAPSSHPFLLNPDGTSQPSPTGLKIPNLIWGASSIQGDWVAVGTNGGTEALVSVFHKSASGFDPTCTVTTETIISWLRFSPDARYVVSLDANISITTIESATGRILPPCETKDFKQFRDIGWLTPERLVGVGFTDHSQRGSSDFIVVWDVTTGRMIQRIPGTCAMERLAVSADLSVFAEGGDDKHIRIRDAKTLAIIHEFRAHDGPITALVFHPSRPILASGSSDASVRFWDTRHGTLIQEIRASAHEPDALHFSPSGSRFSSCDTAGTARIWELQFPKDSK